jgi:hypothetical protein
MCRCHLVSLNQFITGRPSERTFPICNQWIGIPMSSLQIWCDGPTLRPLETWVWHVSLTMHTGLAGPRRTYLLSLPAFPTCCFPLWVSPPSRLGVLKVLFSTFLPLRENLTRTETAHDGGVVVSIQLGSTVRAAMPAH